TGLNLIARRLYRLLPKLCPGDMEPLKRRYGGQDRKAGLGNFIRRYRELTERRNACQATDAFVSHARPTDIQLLKLQAREGAGGLVHNTNEGHIEISKMTEVSQLRYSVLA